MLIEDYLFSLEECYSTALPEYTMEQIVYKAVIVIKSTGLLAQAILECNGFLLKNETWSKLKDHFCEDYKYSPRDQGHHPSMDTPTTQQRQTRTITSTPYTMDYPPCVLPITPHCRATTTAWWSRGWRSLPCSKNSQ